MHAYTTLPADHPVKICFRTYGLGLLLSLGPALLPFVVEVVVPTSGWKDVDRRMVARKVAAGLGRLLRREVGPFGFAFAITTAVAGGSFLRNVFENPVKPPDNSLQNVNVKSGAATGGLDSAWSTKSRLWSFWASLSNVQRTFLANSLASAVAIVLLQRKIAPPGVPELPTRTEDIPKHRGISPTLNLTLILFVRALDSIVHGGLQGKLLEKSKGEEHEATPRSTGLEKMMPRDSMHARDWMNKWVSTLDALVFSICSARCDRSSSCGSPR